MKFPNFHNKKLAELVGILLGDGSIGIYKCRFRNKTSFQHRIKISLNSKNELEYAGHIENLIESLFDLKLLRRYRTKENTLDLLIFNKYIVNFLIDKLGLFLSPKKGRAKIPKIYLKNSLELLVLKGYFDTDGCLAIVNNNGILYPRLEMKVCKSPMQMQFVDILERNKFRFGFYKIENDNIRIQLNGLNELNKWYNLIGFSNTKILERYRKMMVAGERFERSTCTQRYHLFRVS